MSMEQLKSEMLSILKDRYALTSTPVPDDLREIRLPLGALVLNMYNWRMDRVRKISVMRTSIKIPKLEIFAIEIYPEADFDIPLLAIDFSWMKKKTFIYMNFIPLFADSDYHEKYIARLQPIREQYTIEPPKKPKEWMNPYINDYTVYAMADNALLDGARQCAADYLSCYLDMLDAAEPITDPDYRARVEHAGTVYCDDLSEKDGSRNKLGRFIGKDRADRIFREVIR